MAIVISESGKEKLTSYRIDEISININTNDILINLFGDNDEYKSFPDIGEKFSKFLCARRRIDYDSILTDLKTKELNNINYSNDTVFYSDGEVIDISVYSNADTEKLEKHKFNEQLVKYIKKDEAYYEKVYEVLSEIVEENSKENYSDDLAYQYKRAKEITDDEIVWRNNGKEFSNIIVKFRILQEKECRVGSKISGRSGNKGIISKIIPDEEMPTTESGEKAEVLLNPLGK
jgi:DNA-directed RNA polymerase beta subunit